MLHSEPPLPPKIYELSSTLVVNKKVNIGTHVGTSDDQILNYIRVASKQCSH